MKVIGYKIYFWSNENNEPIHVQISKGKLTQNSTKVWLTKAGGCILCNNKSRISNSDLNKLLNIIMSQAQQLYLTAVGPFWFFVF